MKTILLVDADADLAGEVLEAAAKTGHAVRLAKTSRDAFQVLSEESEDVDLAIVDVDRGTHGMAPLEAISARERHPPVIVMTALEESYVKPIAERHGASACLAKPVSIEKLRSTIDEAPLASRRIVRCDLWGHPGKEQQRKHECGS
jgi:DNA-binding NtrC family response regulator